MGICGYGNMEGLCFVVYLDGYISVILLSCCMWSAALECRVLLLCSK